MVRYTGKLSISEDGLSINIPLSSSGDEIYDVPLVELFDHLIGEEVSIEINRVVRISESDIKGEGKK
jgi:hypothetical protein